MKLGHFDKHFIKKSRKKAPQGKILEFFLLDTLKTTVLNGKFNQRMDTIRAFFYIHRDTQVLKIGVLRKVFSKQFCFIRCRRQHLSAVE